MDQHNYKNKDGENLHDYKHRMKILFGKMKTFKDDKKEQINKMMEESKKKFDINMKIKDEAEKFYNFMNVKEIRPSTTKKSGIFTEIKAKDLRLKL